MSETTETDREFEEGLSPCCIVLNQDRAEAVSDTVARYARKKGADQTCIAWGTLRARNALRDGHSGHRAIQYGERAVDDYLFINGG